MIVFKIDYTEGGFSHCEASVFWWCSYTFRYFSWPCSAAQFQVATSKGSVWAIYERWLLSEWSALSRKQSPLMKFFVQLLNCACHLAHTERDKTETGTQLPLVQTCEINGCRLRRAGLSEIMAGIRNVTAPHIWREHITDKTLAIGDRDRVLWDCKLCRWLLNLSHFFFLCVAN